MHPLEEGAKAVNVPRPKIRLDDGCHGKGQLAAEIDAPVPRTQELVQNKSEVIDRGGHLLHLLPEVTDRLNPKTFKSFRHIVEMVEEGKLKGQIRQDVPPEDVAWALHMFAWTEDLAVMAGEDGSVIRGSLRRNLKRMLDSFRAEPEPEEERGPKPRASGPSKSRLSAAYAATTAAYLVVIYPRHCCRWSESGRSRMKIPTKSL